MKEYAKLRVETNREMLVFWAVLFFTCVVGIIELLSEIKVQSFSSGLTPSWTNAQSYIFLIYFGLLIGMILSVHSAFSRYKESNRLVLDGELGAELKNYAETHPTWMDTLIRWRANIILEAIIIVSILFVFVLLYCVKIGLLT